MIGLFRVLGAQKYLSSKMGQERILSLAALAIERDITLDNDDIVTKCSLLPDSKIRRLNLQ